MRRSAAAEQYRHLYNTPQWKALRAQILNRDNYTCQWISCGKLLVGTHRQHNGPAVHHKRDHKGDKTLFFDPFNLIAVCKECHDKDIQRYTHRGYIAGADEDGRPIDPNHPWNSKA